MTSDVQAAGRSWVSWWAGILDALLVESVEDGSVLYVPRGGRGYVYRVLESAEDAADYAGYVL